MKSPAELNIEFPEYHHFYGRDAEMGGIISSIEFFNVEVGAFVERIYSMGRFEPNTLYRRRKSPANGLDNMKGGRIDISRKQLAQIYREAELRAQLATCQKELSEAKASNERMREALKRTSGYLHGSIMGGTRRDYISNLVDEALSQPNQKEEV